MVHHAGGTNPLEPTSEAFRERAGRLRNLRVRQLDNLVLTVSVAGMPGVEETIGDTTQDESYLDTSKPGAPVVFHDFTGDGWRGRLRRRLAQHLAAVSDVASTYTDTFTLLMTASEEEREDLLRSWGVAPEHVHQIRTQLGIYTDSDRSRAAQLAPRDPGGARSSGAADRWSRWTTRRSVLSSSRLDSPRRTQTPSPMASPTTDPPPRTVPVLRTLPIRREPAGAERRARRTARASSGHPGCTRSVQAVARPARRPPGRRPQREGSGGGRRQGGSRGHAGTRRPRLRARPPAGGVPVAGADRTDPARARGRHASPGLRRRNHTRVLVRMGANRARRARLGAVRRRGSCSAPARPRSRVGQRAAAPVSGRPRQRGLSHRRAQRGRPGRRGPRSARALRHSWSRGSRSSSPARISSGCAAISQSCWPTSCPAHRPNVTRSTDSRRRTDVPVSAAPAILKILNRDRSRRVSTYTHQVRALVEHDVQPRQPAGLAPPPPRKPRTGHKHVVPARSASISSVARSGPVTRPSPGR